MAALRLSCSKACTPSYPRRIQLPEFILSVLTLHKSRVLLPQSLLSAKHAQRSPVGRNSLAKWVLRHQALPPGNLLRGTRPPALTFNPTLRQSPRFILTTPLAIVTTQTYCNPSLISDGQDEEHCHPRGGWARLRCSGRVRPSASEEGSFGTTAREHLIAYIASYLQANRDIGSCQHWQPRSSSGP